MMAAGTNASESRDGYAFQEMAALVLFLKNIKNIEKITVEGEEDIDIYYKDGDIKYVQAKRFSNPYTTTDTKGKLSRALEVLALDNIENRDKPIKLAYITNSTVPFLKTSQDKKNDFTGDYALFEYLDLAPKIKERIVEVLQSIHSNDPEITDKQKVLNTAILQLEMDLENKFEFIKLKYEGSDFDTKTSYLLKEVENFLHNLELGNSLARTFMKDWYWMMINSSTNKNISLTKELFIGQTILTTIFYENRLDVFSKEYNLDYDEEELLNSRYREMLDVIMSNYQTMRGVRAEYKQFRKKNPAMAKEEELKQFLESNEVVQIAKEMWNKDVNSEELTVTKYIVWSIVKYGRNMERVEGAVQ